MKLTSNTRGGKYRLILLLLYGALLIIHFIIKDRFQYLSAVFYACPLPLIIIFGLMVTATFFRRKPIFYFLLSILVANGIYFYIHYFGSAVEGNPSEKTSHILFWNVAKNQPLPTDILIKHIKEFNPEIVALVEAIDVSKEDLTLLKKAFPDYYFQSLKGNMLLGVKGTVENIVFKSENNVYKFNYIKVNIGQSSRDVMIADVYAGPLLNKEIPLDIIKNVSKNYQVEILVGDFNTPYESVFFNDFTDNYNSFHSVSIGMTTTWPTPIPVLEIDQIWVAKSYLPLKMQKFTYEVSDHKLLIAEYQKIH